MDGTARIRQPEAHLTSAHCSSYSYYSSTTVEPLKSHTTARSCDRELGNPSHSGSLNQTVW